MITMHTIVIYPNIRYGEVEACDIDDNDEYNEEGEQTMYKHNWISYKYTYIIIGLLEVQIEPTSTMMTSAEDTVPLSQ